MTREERAGRLRRALFRSWIGWRSARWLASRPGEERARRFVALMLLLQRASYLAPAIVHAATDRGYRDTTANLALLAAATAWNVALFVAARRRGWFSRRMVAGDVAIACLLLVAGAALAPAGQELTSVNWPTRYALATGALIGAVLDPRPMALALAPIVLTYTAALGTVLGAIPPLVTGLNSLIWFTVIAHVMRRYLCAQGQALDETARQRLAAETRRSAEQARHAERLAHHRALHDTVLATLTAIARGGLDHRDEVVRRRCAREADYVRRLISSESPGAHAGLPGRLAGVIAEAEEIGLRIRYQHDAVPDHLPPDVVDAVADACREALNNVAAHAGASLAWVTVTWDDGLLTTRVVDRGKGYDPDAVTPGFGLRRSVLDRMWEIGGEATVSAMEGEGVCVELTWRAAHSPARPSRPSASPDPDPNPAASRGIPH